MAEHAVSFQQECELNRKPEYSDLSDLSPSNYVAAMCLVGEAFHQRFNVRDAEVARQCDVKTTGSPVLQHEQSTSADCTVDNLAEHALDACCAWHSEALSTPALSVSASQAAASDAIHAVVLDLAW
eukprot:6136651-Amphidinium_carterae.1